MPTRTATEPRVYLNGVVARHLRAARCEQSIGGGRDMGVAVLVRIIEQFEQPVQNLSLDPDLEAIVDVRIGDPFIPGDQTVLHWGSITAEEFALGEQEVSRGYISRMQPHHFGEPLRGILLYNDVAGKVVLQTLPTTFNPRVDDKILANRSRNRIDDVEREDNDFFPFVHPDSLRSPQAAYSGQQMDAAQKWDLTEAVLYLCNLLNPTEPWIKNPDRADVKPVVGNDPFLLRDVEMPMGIFLPEALDRLLEPHGFGWCVELEMNRRTIRLFDKNAPSLVLVPGQSLGEGEHIDPFVQEYCAAGIDWSLAECVNEVRILGDYKRYEITIELCRAWPVADDALHASDLKVIHAGDPNDTSSQFLEKPRVWRDFVANEAGDYTGTRDGGSPGIPHEPYFAFGSKIGLVTPEDFGVRRRKMLPMLTRFEGDPAMQDEIGQSHGVELEWWDKAANNGAGGWRPNAWNFAILDREFGIRFTDAFPPQEIVDQGAGAKVRVTCSVASDARLEGLAPFDGVGPAVLLRPLLLEMPDHFFYRVVTGISKYADRFLDPEDIDGPYADQIDDSEKIENYAIDVRDAWDQADVHGTIELEGCDRTAYLLGDGISRLGGREISLSGGRNGRHPLLVGIGWDFRRQRTYLKVASYRRNFIKIGRAG